MREEDQSNFKCSRRGVIITKILINAGLSSPVLCGLALYDPMSPLPPAIDGNVLRIDEFSITQTDSRDDFRDVLWSPPSP